MVTLVVFLRSRNCNGSSCRTSSDCGDSSQRNVVVVGIPLGQIVVVVVLKLVGGDNGTGMLRVPMLW